MMAMPVMSAARAVPTRQDIVDLAGLLKVSVTGTMSPSAKASSPP